MRYHVEVVDITGFQMVDKLRDLCILQTKNELTTVHDEDFVFKHNIIISMCVIKYIYEYCTQIQ